jgi:hypothetical protein
MKYCVSCRWSSGRERNRCQYREWRCESKRGVVDGGPRTDEIPTREVFIGGSKPTLNWGLVWGQKVCSSSAT